MEHNSGTQLTAIRLGPYQFVGLVVRRANVHGIVATGLRPGWLSGKRAKRCGQLDYSRMAVLKFSRSLICPKFTLAQDRCRYRVHAGDGQSNRRHDPQRHARRTAEGLPPPYVPGMEAAGIVDEIGSGVPDRL